MKKLPLRSPFFYLTKQVYFGESDVILLVYFGYVCVVLPYQGLLVRISLSRVTITTTST